MPKMGCDQQRLIELSLPSAHYVSSCKSMVPHPQPLPGTVPCFHAVTNPLNLLLNPANHSSNLPSNQHNQCSKYGLEPQFVSQIVCITTQEPREDDAARIWYLNITDIHRCRVIVVVG